MNIAEKAKVFAIAAHAAVNQKRKYTGDDYHVHPINVAHMVESVSDDIEMMAAAYLHDVVEDTAVTVELIEVMFGSNIAALVDGLTDKSKPSDGNRAVRKAIDSDNLARQCPNVKTIKLADLIDNSSSIALHDPGFAKVYMREKRDLLEVLGDGDKKLLRIAKKIVHDYFKGESL